MPVTAVRSRGSRLESEPREASAGGRPGRVGPAAVRRLADQVPTAGRLLDAPVLGSLSEVESGSRRSSSVATAIRSSAAKVCSRSSARRSTSGYSAAAPSRSSSPTASLRRSRRPRRSARPLRPARPRPRGALLRSRRRAARRPGRQAAGTREGRLKRLGAPPRESVKGARGGRHPTPCAPTQTAQRIHRRAG